MSCDCPTPTKSPLWTAVPEYRQPTDIQPGENIDCYAARSGSVSGEKNDIGAQPENRILNTSLTSDLNLGVNVTFKLTPTSTRTATGWQISVNGVSGLAPLTELTFDTSTGVLSGTVLEANANQQYKVLVEADDGSGFIDSREFNFFPKKAGKGDTIKFIKPLADGTVTSHVTCGYGPRAAPAFGASTFHKGYDFAMTDHSLGNIVASSDGTVVAAGPATGFGNWIIIEHYDQNSTCVASTVYGHMNDGNIYVTVGQQVAAGQKIALEGNKGIGSGAHLHFEIHKGKWKQGGGVDPGPYLQGSLSVAQNNDPTVLPSDSTDGNYGPTDFATQTNSNPGMTTAEAMAPPACPSVLPNDTALPPPGPQNPPSPPTNNQVSNRSSCAPATSPDTATVIAAIQQACNDAGYATGSSDANFIQTVATIESNLDPYAKNPTSSATGLYQMLDSIAVHYYGIIGQTPTCANRCDPYLATKAFIAFYQAEFLPYYNNYVASGKTTIAGKSIQATAWSSQYPTLGQNEFMYGLIHHDGVGNAVAGKDLGGVAYWRSKVT
jgi:murein DD-endopeptidase MepM/ murein hydrolase activator NlpD